MEVGVVEDARAMGIRTCKREINGGQSGLEINGGGLGLIWAVRRGGGRGFMWFLMFVSNMFTL